MPWVLAALVALTGVTYYEANKKPTLIKYKLIFPPEAKNLNIVGPLMSLAGSVGGTVIMLDDTTFILSVPAKADLTKLFPQFPMPPSQIQVATDMTPVSGVRVGEEYFEDAVMYRFNQGSNDQPAAIAGSRVVIAGHVWNGMRLV